MANIPQTVSIGLVNLSDNPIIIMLTINLLLLFVGTFMDMTPAVLIFTPIFLPVVRSLGMHEVHFGIMLIANLCIGLCTPPVGTCLFIGCGVGKTTIAKVTKYMLPFFGSMAVALMIITYFPNVSLWLPVQTGQLKSDEIDASIKIWNQNIFGTQSDPSKEPLKSSDGKSLVGGEQKSGQLIHSVGDDQIVDVTVLGTPNSLVPVSPSNGN